MTRRGVSLLVAGILAISLAIGIFWTIRLAPPSPTPWWWGKNPKVMVEVWEPGKDMATVAMRLPKSMFDTFIAFGLPAVVSINEGKEFRFNDIWKRLERLPRGQKLKFEEDGATITVWLEIDRTNSE